MNRISFAVIFAAAIVFSGCRTLKDSNESAENSAPQVIDLPEIEVEPEPEKVYHGSNTITNDLLHTRLDVSFDWEKQHLLGEAELTFKPHFYDVDSLVIDAKGMDLHTVAMLSDNDQKKNLSFSYDSLQIFIDLDSTFTRTDTFTVYIDYTARPNDLPEGGSAAISSDKGLYFINPLGEEDKPQQIWTQGETEASSCWFPTMDTPNEKTTQEIFITVDDRFKTLSNGELVYSNFNADNTRTDYWKQDLRHAPYLFMMTVGEFSVGRDKWMRASGEEIPVDYYVEEEYQDYVFKIFGNTPDMIEFYSNALGYEYPWAKYSQVAVRDYVSGAMENTSASIFGEFVQQTDRELLDGDREAIIAHELFHHWFGDLVTCESWANLPLNESFATYGEYLWFEHKYGKDKADYHRQNANGGYFSEAQNKKVDLIRFNYDHRMDMFDAHSYNKGGAILHMLRKTIGDEAFFVSLEKYLRDNEFEPAEIHHLRLAVEEVTGKDMNWFFNQWFLNSGHPVLDISYFYNDSLNQQQVVIKQLQDLESASVFKLPIDVEIWNGDEHRRQRVWLEHDEQIFRFDVDSKPTLVKVDADKSLLAQKTDNKPDEMWQELWANSSNYFDRYEALNEALNRSIPGDTTIIFEALSDPFWNIRAMALEGAQKIKAGRPQIENVLNQMVDHDPNSRVVATAIESIASIYPEKNYDQLFVNHLSDSSYTIIGAALFALSEVNPEKAMSEAKKLEDEESMEILLTIAELYAQDGSPKHNEFFIANSKEISGFELFPFMQSYSTFLNGQNDQVINKAIPIFVSTITETETWWVKFSGYQGLTNIRSDYEAQLEDLEKELSAAQSSENTDPKQVENLKSEISRVEAQIDKVQKVLEELKEKETNERILGMMGSK
jgi:aminopeptidase N